MIDMDALKAEIASEVFAQIACDPFYAEFAIRDGTGDRIVDGVLAIIARHMAPVVAPEPDAEVRDVLAEALKVYYGIPADERAPEADGIADAGLAALRAKGFAVVRTADVEPRTCAGCRWYSWPDRGFGDCGKLKQSVAETFGCAAWEAKR